MILPKTYPSKFLLEPTFMDSSLIDLMAGESMGAVQRIIKSFRIVFSKILLIFVINFLQLRGRIKNYVKDIDLKFSLNSYS